MSNNQFNICVIGLGYIGLPTASILASKGYNVLGVDNNTDIVNTIKNGKIHIKEPELDKKVKSVIKSGKLKISLNPGKSDIFIITVQTPLTYGNKPDISYIRSAVNEIAPLIQNNNLVILESTSPVGTTEKIKNWISEKNPKVNFHVAHCPERVLPGNILKEIIENNRVVGGLNNDDTKKVADFYKSFVDGKILKTNAQTAEMVKLVENSYRDVNIAFANELSMISERLSINIWELINLANHHPRVNILKPGPGVGGHCIAVDPWFIVNHFPKNTDLIKTARLVNNKKPEWVLEKVIKASHKFDNPTIGCLGLTYKNDIDDLRESPALYITKKLKENNIGNVIACEPNLKSTVYDNILLYSLEETIKISDIILVLVNHYHFRQIVNIPLDGKVLIDTKGINNF